MKCKRHSGLLYITWDIILLYYHISCEQLMLIVTLRTCVRLFQSRISDFYFKLLDLQEHYTVGRAVNTLLNTNPSDHEAKFFSLVIKFTIWNTGFPSLKSSVLKLTIVQALKVMPFSLQKWYSNCAAKVPFDKKNTNFTWWQKIEFSNNW